MNNINPSSEEKTKNKTSFLNRPRRGSMKLYAWVFGIIFLLSGIGCLASSSAGGIVFLLIAGLLLPPVTAFIKKKWNVSLSRNMRIIIAVTILVISPIVFAASSVSSSSNAVSTAPTTTTQTSPVTTPTSPQATVAKSGVEKACDPSKDPSLYYADKMTLCVTTYDSIVNVDEASGMTPAQAAASANGDATPTVQTTANQSATVPVAPVRVAPAPAPQTDNQNTSPVSNETVSQTNAVAKAIDYLNYTAFSHDGLVAQLEYDQFSHADAVYGADNSGANWNEQAAAKAKSYMSYTAFSRGGLITQLEYDKFTQAQAEYGANAVGL